MYQQRQSLGIELFQVSLTEYFQHRSVEKLYLKKRKSTSVHVSVIDLGVSASGMVCSAKS